MKNWLESEGFKTENGKYYQKPIENGWYVDVVLQHQNKAQIYALHESQTKNRIGKKSKHTFQAYDYNWSNHSNIKIKGLTSGKNYVRNKKLSIDKCGLSTLNHNLFPLKYPLENYFSIKDWMNYYFNFFSYMLITILL